MFKLPYVTNVKSGFNSLINFFSLSLTIAGNSSAIAQINASALFGDLVPMYPVVVKDNNSSSSSGYSPINLIFLFHVEPKLALLLRLSP